MDNSFSESYAWSEQYGPAIRAIVRANLHLCVSPQAPSLDDDQMQGVDLVLSLDAPTFGVRVRDFAKPYRDMTIRSSRASGACTELEKMKRGDCASLYLYCWGSCGEIREWVIVSMARLRASGLLDICRYEHRAGNERFVSVEMEELERENCILARKMASIACTVEVAA